MSDMSKAVNYFNRMYTEAWTNWNFSKFKEYYHKDVKMYSGDLEINYDELCEHHIDCSQRFSCAIANCHNIMAGDANHIIAWFTQIIMHDEQQEAFRIQTMSNYKIVDDKIVRVDFMWDKPANFIMPILNKCRKGSLNGAVSDIEDILTRRELETFFYLIQGRSAKQIAKIMRLSNRTIEDYAARIRFKLNFNKTSDIIEYAIQENLIHMSPLFTTLLESENSERK